MISLLEGKLPEGTQSMCLCFVSSEPRADPGSESALCKYLLHKSVESRMTPENDPKGEEVFLTGKRGQLCDSQLAFQENNSSIRQHLLGTSQTLRHHVKHFPC